MSDAKPFSHIGFYGTVEDCLPDAEFRSLARQLSTTTHTGIAQSLVVARASELLGPERFRLPKWVDTGTRYLVVSDVPEQAILRLASTLRLHKPDERLQVCRDPLVVKRLVIALTRPAPWEGILDAYILEESLVVVLDPPLQGPQLARNKHAGMLPPQTPEEILRCAMRLGLQPLHHAGPRRLERVVPGAPPAWRFRRGLVSRPHFPQLAKRVPGCAGIGRVRHRVAASAGPFAPAARAARWCCTVRISSRSPSGSSVPSSARRSFVAAGIASDASSLVHGVSGA